MKLEKWPYGVLVAIAVLTAIPGIIVEAAQVCREVHEEIARRERTEATHGES